MSDRERQQAIETATTIAKQKIQRLNILVCGYTGSGKSSLIQAILGDKIVPADAIGNNVPTTPGFICYPKDNKDNPLVRVFDSKGMELGEKEEDFLKVTRDFIKTKQDPEKLDDFIHLVWYTIQGPGARVTDCDKELINNIFAKNNLIVCITKADGMRGSQKEAMKKAVMDAGVPESHIIFTSDKEGGRIGNEELMELSVKLLPSAYQVVFEEAQVINLERRLEAVKKKATKAKVIISAAAAAAGGIGYVPIPGSDAPLLVAAQTAMIGSLAALYGITDDAIKVGMLPFLAKLAGTNLASSLLKLIPGLGTLVGGTITAAVASSLTFAMGMYVKSYFEKCAIAKIKGEPMPEVPWDADAFKAFYEQYQNSKENADNAGDSAK